MASAAVSVAGLRRIEAALPELYTDRRVAGSPVGQRTHQWDAAAGTWFWIDPENQIVFVGLIRPMLQEGMPPLQAMTQSLVAEALG